MENGVSSGRRTVRSRRSKPGRLAYVGKASRLTSSQELEVLFF
jgi:hypothetical protein